MILLNAFLFQSQTLPRFFRSLLSMTNVLSIYPLNRLCNMCGLLSSAAVHNVPVHRDLVEPEDQRSL